MTGVSVTLTLIAVDLFSTYTYNTRIRRCAMQKKLTLTVDAEVYEGLRKIIGPRKISRFIEDLVRPHVVRPNLDAAYAKMARDKKRENEAMEWAEITFEDMNNAAE
jgi:predicted CopG family antitoxin